MKKRLSLPLAALFVFAALNHQDTLAFYPPGGMQWDQPVRPKKVEIKKRLLNQIDNLCLPKDLSMKGKIDVTGLKKQVEKIIDRILNEYNFTTETAAFNACEYAMHDAITQFAAGIVYNHAEIEAKKWISGNPPINPRFINKIEPVEFATKLAQDMAYTIKKDCENNNRGSFKKFFNGEIIKEVAHRTALNYRK